MKLFKLLLIVPVLFFLVACGDDEETTGNRESTQSEGAVDVSERDAYIQEAAGRGVESADAGCIYDMLFEDIGSNFYKQFNDPDYDLTEEDQAAAVKATQECGVLTEEVSDEELPEVKETAIQELMTTLTISEEDATCLVDGVVKEYGSNILGTDRTPTPEDQQRIIEIATVCNINLTGGNSTTTLPSTEN